MSTTTPDPAGAIADRYRIERELGRGGMATVWLADDLKHGRKVAIKFMHPEMAAAIGPDRFLREIEIAARLSHPHILPLYDSGAVDGKLYYVMPYVTGESLRARLDREHQLPLEDTLRLAREIASALGHAHAQGLVHRDVKPENVLLSDGIALVADFGIARARAASGTEAATQLAAGATHVGTMLGTPRYMAPEQATGSADVDGRADQYALGCVLYEMLAGRPPFDAPSMAVLLERHAHETPAPIRVHRLGVPDAVERVVAKTLAKSPADRYPTMGRFAEALAAATIGGATPTPAPEGHEAATANNLPRQRTSFIGRERELAECARLMGETRLLTLTGVGGCGKTRLALKLAEMLLDGHPDGVWFVDLAPLNDGARVAQAVAVALGVRDESGHDLAATLARYVSDRRMLLVLDNCEHLLSDTAALVDTLLAAGGDVRVLATSREGLGVEGERLAAVSALPVPPADRHDDAQVIGAIAAVRLFAERARLVEAGFQITPANAETVAEICRRLDGIPLAIELAAARAKVLSVEEIRVRLDDRFRLLTGGHRALPRHQTLRATIQWSYDQLTEEEQRLFRLQSVFVSGWTLDAAAAVAESDEFEVLESLSRLVDKSLVGVERLDDGTSRYRMLETFRQFAQEKLDGSGEGEAARLLHLRFFTDWSVQRSGHSRGATQAEWLSQLDREHENLLAALDFAPGGEGSQLALRIIGAMSRYWYLRGLAALAAERIDASLASPGAEVPTSARGVALLAASANRWVRGKYPEALALGEESLALLEVSDDPISHATILNSLANTWAELRDLDRSREFYERALAVAMQHGVTDMARVVRLNLTEVLREQGERDAARPLIEQGIAESRAAGDLENLATMLANLSTIDMQDGRLTEATSRLLEAYRIVCEHGFRRQGVNGIEGAAGLAATCGDDPTAARWYAVVATLRAEGGLGRENVEALVHDPILAVLRERMGEVSFSGAAGKGPARYETALGEIIAWLETRARV